VGIDRIQAEAHGDDRHVRPASIAPHLDFPGEFTHIATTQRYIVAAELVDRPSDTSNAFTQPCPGLRCLDATTEEDEAVSEPGSSIEYLLARSAKPNRNRSCGLGYECHSVNPVKATREVDDGLGEQTAKQLDLLLLSSSAGMKVLPKGLVLNMVPADSDTESEPTPGQEVDIGSLPCHECSLALGKDQDSSGESDPFGDASQVPEHHKRVMERIVLGVGARQWRRPIGMNGAQHVLVGKKVIKAQVLDRFRKSTNCGGIAMKLDLGVYDANLHEP